jgi:hypothetical protein
VSPHDFDPGDLLFFSPSEEGGDWRTGHIRARDFDLFTCKTYVVMGQCPSDYVFVATAIGEHAFTREPAPEEVS